MTIEVKYRTTATAVGGRDGRAYTQDGTFDLEVSTPKELGGTGGPGTNPEQLFAAGYSACFLSALKLVGRKRKIDIAADSSVSATVGIGSNGLGGFGLVVQLSAGLPGGRTDDRGAARRGSPSDLPVFQCHPWQC